MSTINPYINFDGRCREAMTFYKDIFGGELILNQVGGSPMEPYHKGDPAAIYHSSLVNGPIVLMGTDMTGPPGYQKGNNISMAIACSSAEDARNFFDKLAEGGRVVMPLEKTFWAELFGDVVDKFGIEWMLNYDGAAAQ
ncbi:VOC family protein [Mucilaginibacter myungsuensis]|uniref:VOC family protein n=1 Tax=Mucilaginibacter myungsuensis TaxID=649104 RepID=A0A929KYF9_9SPHI|nr:VOC family protein [Mucilaginibacter myungsuensis]MBE9663986.1 VOC family protein [Mucilaginibacter myungsuensis]MDN3601165.1 VOC family protein [Mucilaginibacter myungsuensis]